MNNQTSLRQVTLIPVTRRYAKIRQANPKLSDTDAMRQTIYYFGLEVNK